HRRPPARARPSQLRAPCRAVELNLPARQKPRQQPEELQDALSPHLRTPQIESRNHPLPTVGTIRRLRRRGFVLPQLGREPLEVKLWLSPAVVCPSKFYEGHRRTPSCD